MLWCGVPTEPGALRQPPDARGIDKRANGCDADDVRARSSAGQLATLVKLAKVLVTEK